MLAVDNNSDVRHLLKIRLKKAGYHRDGVTMSTITIQ